jgi:hypothetical protein
MPRRKRRYRTYPPLNDKVLPGIPDVSGVGGAMTRETVVLDIYLADPLENKTYLASRIWFTPYVLKRFRDDIDRLVKDYEKSYGKVKT